jgi:hypothetical protein
MTRRLAAYRELNKSQVADPSVTDFFRSHNVQVLEKDAAVNKDQVWESLKIYIERIEKPHNFLSNDVEAETKRRILVEQRIRAAEAIENVRV